jgi:hypothetical protein
VIAEFGPDPLFGKGTISGIPTPSCHRAVTAASSSPPASGGPSAVDRCRSHQPVGRQLRIKTETSAASPQPRRPAINQAAGQPAVSFRFGTAGLQFSRIRQDAASLSDSPHDGGRGRAKACAGLDAYL